MVLRHGIVNLSGYSSLTGSSSQVDERKLDPSSGNFSHTAMVGWSYEENIPGDYSRYYQVSPEDS
jgi:hypothetical protein